MRLCDNTMGKRGLGVLLKCRQKASQALVFQISFQITQSHWLKIVFDYWTAHATHHLHNLVQPEKFTSVFEYKLAGSGQSH